MGQVMDVRKTEQILLVSFCTLIVIPLLYIGRVADDNALTSWRWVFPSTGILQVFFTLVPALLCAYALSELRFASLRAYVFLPALSCLAVLPLWQEPEAIIDASRYFVQAKYLGEHGAGYFLREWGGRIPAWTDLPLVPFVYGLIFRWFGEERIYIQIFNTLLFALTCLLTFAVGRKLWDEETGLNAGLLLMGIPYLLTQVPLLLVDVPTMFFFTLSVYAFINAVEKGGLAWAGIASVSLFLALFSKYSAWLMLGVVPIMALVLMQGDTKTTFRRSAAVLLTAGLLAAAVISLNFDLFREQMAILWTYQWSGLGRWQEGYVSTFLFQSHPFLTLLALLGIYRAVRQKDRRFLVAGWFAVFVFLLQIKRMRYILPLFPLFALMAAYGLNAFRDQGVRRFICLCVVASSVVVAYCAYLPFLNSTSMANLQHAGRYLDTLECSSVDVFALPQKDSSGSTFASIPILDYHTSKKLFSPQEWPLHPENSDTRRSSLRFTWETRRPELYSRTDTARGCALAVISSEVIEAVPAALAGEDRGLFEELKRFDLGSGVFKYQTLVTIFKKQ
jgi:uncharacterized membrane protein (GlpM family)